MLSFHKQSPLIAYTVCYTQTESTISNSCSLSTNRVLLSATQSRQHKQIPQSATDALFPQTESSNCLHNLLHTNRVHNQQQMLPLHKQSPLISYTISSTQTDSTISNRCSLSTNRVLLSDTQSCQHKPSPQSATDAPSPKTESTNQLHNLLQKNRVHNQLQMLPLQKQSLLISCTISSTQTVFPIRYTSWFSTNRSPPVQLHKLVLNVVRAHWSFSPTCFPFDSWQLLEHRSCFSLLPRSFSN